MEKKKRNNEKRKERKQAQRKRKDMILERKNSQRQREIENFADEILSIGQQPIEKVSCEQSNMTEPDTQETQFQERYNAVGPWCKVEGSLVPVSRYATRQSSDVLVLQVSPEDMEF